VGAKRIIWHVGFERIRRRGPPSFEARAEVPLSDEPPRPDYLLLRKIAVEGQTLDDTAHTLRRLWLMGLAWEDLGDGYWRVQGGLFTLHLVEIDVVGPAEGDDLLHSLGNGKPSTPEARWFWMEFVGSQEARMSMQDMEGFDEALDKFLSTLTPEQRVAGLPPEQRMAGLPPEQRMAGLPPEEVLAGFDRDHQALALPLEVLRLLPESYLRSLSPDVEAELRRRLARPGG
jgi:hypothetical protein